MIPEKPTPAAVASVAPHPAQPEDLINLRKILLVGVISLLIFAVGIFASIRIMAGLRPDLRGPGSVQGAYEIGRPEIGIVDQVPFAGDQRLVDWARARRQRLDGYGWIDRARGIAHIPIDTAIDLAVAGALPEAAPSPTTRPRQPGLQ